MPETQQNKTQKQSKIKQNKINTQTDKKTERKTQRYIH